MEVWLPLILGKEFPMLQMIMKVVKLLLIKRNRLKWLRVKMLNGRAVEGSHLQEKTNARKYRSRRMEEERASPADKGKVILDQELAKKWMTSILMSQWISSLVQKHRKLSCWRAIFLRENQNYLYTEEASQSREFWSMLYMLSLLMVKLLKMLLKSQKCNKILLACFKNRVIQMILTKQMDQQI